MSWFDVVRPVRTAAALAAVLAVTACGGGGGGDNKDPSTEGTAQSVSSAKLADINEAKTLIQNVRSNADKSVTNQLAQRWQALSDQFQGTLLPVNEQSLQLILTTIQMSAVLEGPARELGAAFTASYPIQGGVCNLYKDDQAKVAATSYEEVESIQCATTVAFDLRSSTSSTGESSLTQQLLTQEVKVSKTPTAHGYAVQSVLYLREVTHHVAANGEASDTYGDITDLSDVNTAAVTLSPTSDGASYNGVTLKGDLAPSAYDILQVGFNTKTAVDLSATVSVSGGLTRLNLKGLAQTLVDGEAGMKSLINDGSYLQVRVAVPGDVGSALVNNQAGAAAHLLISTTAPEGASQAGVLEIDLSAFDVAKGTGHGKVNFDGKLFKASGDLLFDGKITLTVPTDLVLVPGQDPVSKDGSIAFEGTLPIPDRPAMIVNLTTDTKRATTHSFSGSFVQGTTKVLINGSFNEGTGQLINLTLSTPSGVTATVHSNDEDFNITKGSEVLGVFTKSNGRILYADNTYDQF